MSSVGSEEDGVDWSTEIPIIYADGCEDYIAEFLSGRDLTKLTEADEEQRQKHEVKYRKELELDAKSTRKGFPLLKKYREELINKESKCDAQFINNLHTYYGDGSRLQKTPKPHYAVDFVRVNGIESEETLALKSLKVAKKKQIHFNSLPRFPEGKSLLPGSPAPEDVVRLANQSVGPVRVFHLSVAPKRIKFCLNTRDGPMNISAVNNADETFQLPESSKPYNSSFVVQSIPHTFSRMVHFVNLLELDTGIIQVDKVLFSTDDLHAYVLLRTSEDKLKKFSSNYARELRPTDPPEKSNFWNKVNVVLYLPEFKSEGTEFRRARHVVRLWPRDKPMFNEKNYVSEDLYVELDTGMLRAHRSSAQTVRLLKKMWVVDPVPILEVRFENAMNQQDVTDRIEQIRRTGRALIDSLDVADNRKNRLKDDSQPSLHSRMWSDIETAVLRPLAIHNNPSMTGMFCGARDCMGMCCTDKFYQKPPDSPLLASDEDHPSWTPHYESGEVTDVTREFMRPDNYVPPVSMLSPTSEDDTFFDRA